MDDPRFEQVPEPDGSPWVTFVLWLPNYYDEEDEQGFFGGSWSFRADEVMAVIVGFGSGSVYTNRSWQSHLVSVVLKGQREPVDLLDTASHATSEEGSREMADTAAAIIQAAIWAAP